VIDIVLEDDSVQLRPVTDEDLELLMAWRSHPDVYRYFYKQDGPLAWDTHYRFWKTRQDRIDWIIYLDDGNQKRKVGSVNIIKVSSDCPEVGIFIGEITLMGKGIGTRSVSLVVQWLKTRGFARVRANVSKENMPSQRLFTSLGFKQRGEIHDGAEWVYEKLLN
jgi:RimJ/RimL family protein N-acetyltransferase